MDEPGFAVQYAQMCKNLSSKEVKDASGNKVQFRKILITRCQIEFQKDYMEGINPEKLKEECPEGNELRASSMYFISAVHCSVLISKPQRS